MMNQWKPKKVKHQAEVFANTRRGKVRLLRYTVTLLFFVTMCLIKTNVLACVLHPEPRGHPTVAINELLNHDMQLQTSY